MLTTPRGRFISIEGIEGVGKTTNLTFVRSYLEANGRTLCMTREPGGTGIAERIREILLARADEPLTENAELLLIFAARAQHLQQVIKPSLARGEWVVCDRFTDATFAYQGGGRGLSEEKIAQLESWVQNGLHPDLTLVLDAPVALGMERAAKRGELDRFEIEQQAFFERVRATYLRRAKLIPERYRIIDASRSLPEVQTDIGLALDKLLAGDQ